MTTPIALFEKHVCHGLKERRDFISCSWTVSNPSCTNVVVMMFEVAAGVGVSPRCPRLLSDLVS